MYNRFWSHTYFRFSHEVVGSSWTYLPQSFLVDFAIYHIDLKAAQQKRGLDQFTIMVIEEQWLEVSLDQSVGIR